MLESSEDSESSLGLEGKMSCCATPPRKLTLDTSMDVDLSFDRADRSLVNFDAEFFDCEEPILRSLVDIDTISMEKFCIEAVVEVEAPLPAVVAAVKAKSLPAKKLTMKQKRTRYFNSHVRKEIKRRVGFVKRFWNNPTRSFPVIFKRLLSQLKTANESEFVVFYDFANKLISD